LPPAYALAQELHNAKIVPKYK